MTPADVKYERWQDIRNYLYPWELEQATASFFKCYNNQCYYELLDNLTPADVYLGRVEEVQSRKEKIEARSLQAAQAFNLQMVDV